MRTGGREQNHKEPVVAVSFAVELSFFCQDQQHLTLTNRKKSAVRE